MLNYAEEPKLSIVVPVYGTEQYFERCINSLLRQSYRNIEVIVVNDGSPGNIDEIIGQFNTDRRLKYVVNKKNEGLLRARVIGSIHANGDYIAFVDSDDYVSFDFFRTLIAKAEQDNADIVIGNTVWVSGETKYIYNYHQAGFHFEALKDEEVARTFFEQEMQCYSWHTIWNKIYRKSLWDHCCETFKLVTEHIIMTEDIYFSTILFLNARYVARVGNDAYFYCVNDNASTNSSKITVRRFKKNLSDIRFVFNEIESYAKKIEAAEYVLEAIYSGKRHYARMWANLAVNVFSDEEKEDAIKQVQELYAGVELENVQDEYFFESIKTPWNGGLEYIKEQIANSEKEYISFDIFDTLVKRPFYNPGDLLNLLDTAYYQKTGNNLLFSRIRKEAEQLARRNYGEKMGVEDITLDEIYEVISSYFGIERCTAQEMKEVEVNNEIRFCKPRRSGAELFELALYAGKKVILISDMYLDRKTIETILSRCGITGYSRLIISSEERLLKYTGRLYLRALSSLKIEANNILHIGDGWKTDIEGSKIAGIESIFFPKATEVFENRIKDCVTNKCASLGKETCGENINYEEIKSNLACRCMLSMISNNYFDNPYRTFNSESDLNADPFFIGYYVLGMHLLGVTKWISSCVETLGTEHLYFLSRDGYLPMKAYKLLTHKSHPYIEYIQASRRALMPFIVKDKTNLYELPIEYRAHTPNSLLALLSFLIKDESGRTESDGKEHSINLDYEKSFETKAEYDAFIHDLIENKYDYGKHMEAQKTVSKYYQRLSEKGIAFDMGYSGRIQAAICDAANKIVDVMFIHEDYANSSQLQSNRGFQINHFYDYHPSMTGLIREHLFSDCEGSCIGFQEKHNTVFPIIEESKRPYSDRFVVTTIQNAALLFIKDYMDLFGDYQVLMNYSSQEVSIPFEGFLRRPNVTDLHVFAASYFEDIVYGSREKINIEQFLIRQLTDIGWIKPALNEETERVVLQENDDKEILNMINGSAQWKRGIIWIILDWGFFLKKLKINISRVLRNR